MSLGQTRKLEIAPDEPGHASRGSKLLVGVRVMGVNDTPGTAQVEKQSMWAFETPNMRFHKIQKKILG